MILNFLTVLSVALAGVPLAQIAPPAELPTATTSSVKTPPNVTAPSITPAQYYKGIAKQVDKLQLTVVGRHLTQQVLRHNWHCREKRIVKQHFASIRAVTGSSISFDTTYNVPSNLGVYDGVNPNTGRPRLVRLRAGLLGAVAETGCLCGLRITPSDHHTHALDLFKEIALEAAKPVQLVHTDNVAKDEDAFRRAHKDIMELRKQLGLSVVATEKFKVM
jgi:hypothetical protein